MWETHDSVKIRGHIWYRHSTGESGTAVNFLMTFFDFSFQEAVITLLDGNYKATSNSKPVDFINEPDIYHKKDRVVLPQKNTNNKRLYAYLCNSRCIDYSVVRYFVKKGLIYEDKSNHNIVFLGKDKKGIVRYAGLNLLKVRLPEVTKYTALSTLVYLMCFLFLKLLLTYSVLLLCISLTKTGTHTTT